MSESNEQRRRLRATEAIRATFEQSFDQRVDRYLEVPHQGIVPAHHFAAASSECLDLYRDGFFLSTVMVSQSVAEGIFRFVLERNELSADGDRREMAKRLVDLDAISALCAHAFSQIWRSFRNDVHHMNPNVACVPFREIALRNISDLAVIENEVFAWRTNNGKLVPVRAKYWDLQPDGSVPVFLRLE